MLTLELLPGAELPGPEQGDEVVELAQVVLERRGGQQQDEIPLDFLDELVGRENRAGFQDRKSTRLNSSHGYISYAVFCLKKKKPTSRDAMMDSRYKIECEVLTQNR